MVAFHLPSVSSCFSSHHPAVRTFKVLDWETVEDQRATVREPWRRNAMRVLLQIPSCRRRSQSKRELAWHVLFSLKHRYDLRSSATQARSTPPSVIKTPTRP